LQWDALCKVLCKNDATSEFEPRLAGSGAANGCDPFARNRRSTERRGMGGKGRKGAWRATDAKPPQSLTSVYPRPCDDTSQSTPRPGKHHLRPPRCRGVSATLRRATGPQSSEARVKRQSARARRDDSAEHAAMVNASEGVTRRCQAQPTYSG